jgi:UDP-N-acetylmuramate--alanine ligase
MIQNSNHIKNIFCIGIGGIGMSALARYWKHAGKNVAGYDLRETKLTRKLESESI